MVIPYLMATKRVIRRRVPLAGVGPRSSLKPRAKPQKPVKKPVIEKEVKRSSSRSRRPQKKKVSKIVSSKKTHVSKKKEDKDTGFGFLPIVISILLLAGFIAAIAYIETPTGAVTVQPKVEGFTAEDVPDFPALFEIIKDLDKEYVTDHHEERLGKDMINPIFVKPYVRKVDELWRAVNESDSKEKEIMSQFLEARRRMLISQGFFQQALKYGERGVMTDSFDCRMKDDLLEATLLYNQSFEIGRHAIPRLDYVLRKSKYAVEVLGTNTEKMRFFVTTFGDIKRLVDTNLWAIDEFCVKRESLNNAVEFN